MRFVFISAITYTSGLHSDLNSAILINMEITKTRAKDVLSTNEAAERLGVAVRTIQLWVDAGVLRAWKTAGGHRRVTRDSVEALLASRHEAVTAEPSEEASPTTSPFHILVVEDDDALRLLFEMTLTSWELPITVDVAENGFAGLLRIGTQKPNMLITDLNLPGMDGFSMIRHLRANHEWQNIPIIVVSALAKPEIEARGGVPADIPILGKPVPFDQLELLIRNGINAAKKR